MPPDNIDLLGAIARVRRAMPRNVDVMLICDLLESNVTESSRNVTAQGAQESKRTCPICEGAKTKTRNRVRKHRAK